MARIYRKSDRIKIKIDDVTVTVSPLSAHEKAEIQKEMMAYLKGNIKSGQEGVILSLKYAVKDIEGVLDLDDKPYALKFESGYLTNDCVDDLLNMEITSKLAQVCGTLANGIPKDIVDKDGNKLEGVEIIRGSAPEKNALT
jgi:hypothetical protein